MKLSRAFSVCPSARARVTTASSAGSAGRATRANSVRAGPGQGRAEPGEGGRRGQVLGLAAPAALQRSQHRVGERGGEHCRLRLQADGLQGRRERREVAGLGQRAQQQERQRGGDVRGGRGPWREATPAEATPAAVATAGAEAASAVAAAPGAEATPPRRQPSARRRRLPARCRCAAAAGRSMPLGRSLPDREPGRRIIGLAGPGCA